MYLDFGRTRVLRTCTSSRRFVFLAPSIYSKAHFSPQAKSTPTCITLSPDSSSFVTFSLPDRQIRIFSFLSGKLTRRYDESLIAIQEMQQAGTAVYKVEDMEFGRRLAVERELELPGPDGRIPGMWINAIWDESGAFILYPTLLGIKGKAHATNSLSGLR
jgi:peptidylprolyl isomerase domain and WD repeat-containing protein 1